MWCSSKLNLEQQMFRCFSHLLQRCVTSTCAIISQSGCQSVLFHLHLQVQYMLESDSFDSVQELVRFYVGQRKPVSQSTAAHIYCPVSRTLPLRYLEATFALSNSKQGSYSPSSQRGAYIKRRSVTMTDGLTTEKMLSHR